MDNVIPRRSDFKQMTPAERAIFAAVAFVEGLGADVRLTDAVELLGAARNSVADFVDGTGPSVRRQVTMTRTSPEVPISAAGQRTTEWRVARRQNPDLLTPPERAIFDALQAVRALDVDHHTEVVEQLLSAAYFRVSAHVNGLRHGQEGGVSVDDALELLWILVGPDNTEGTYRGGVLATHEDARLCARKLLDDSGRGWTVR